jgi:uncharacterized membrane protein
MKKSKKSDTAKSEQRVSYPKILVFGSLVGLIASFWQATERIFMLKNPGIDLSCNLSPVVDCGSVLGDRYAAVLGPPNAFIGMVVFTLLLGFGLQRISGGSWTRLVAKLAVIFSIIIFLFSLWFYLVSVYVIGKICIFCVFIWAVSMPIGIYGLKDYLENRANTAGKGIQLTLHNFLNKHHFTLLVTIYATMIALFLLKFREYYFG